MLAAYCRKNWGRRDFGAPVMVRVTGRNGIRQAESLRDLPSISAAFFLGFLYPAEPKKSRKI